ncbi:DNA polymerase IV [Thalassomonas actiniarum]|uniref:DNA polymerase IV n=1 Tax=Thalassomonas actiniarum TaxID=485447 RepID=A0AAE9YPY2_9GAMM|nr:DNA polymerase IV [Thalassomonas actiniarum]WDD98129.1 DNA polymerase IV [Thalassomonas actiniarum]
MRKIIHIDMDCFYAAVEMRDNPEYRDIPLAVGGSGPRSVLCTCNYQAREYGVRSAMPAAKALQLCPDLKIVDGRMAVYQEISQKIRAIFLRYTDIIEPLSLDEAYLDVSDSSECHGSATLIAQQIRQEIFNELNLTASAGIAPNKFLAKIASDENKPNGQCVISPDKVDSFVEQLPLKKIPGIGPKTAEKLKQFGYHTCADVRSSNVSKLQQIVGKFAFSLYQRSFGLDERELETSRLRKSLAIETTLAHDISSVECADVVNHLFPKLVQRLEKHSDRSITRQGVKLKFADFNQTTVELQSQECDLEFFLCLLKKALARADNRGIRLVGLTLGFAEKEQGTSQLSLPI